MKKIIGIFAMLAIAWVGVCAQGANPHLYMRAEGGTRQLFSHGPTGVQFGAEGGVTWLNGLSLGLTMDYYTSKFNGEIDASVSVHGNLSFASVETTRMGADFHSHTNFSVRLVAAYDLLRFIPENRWVELSPEIGFGMYHNSEMMFFEGGTEHETLRTDQQEGYGVVFTLGGRVDVKLPKGWKVGVFTRYYTGTPIHTSSGLAITKTF